jgi:hypothetical protein
MTQRLTSTLFTIDCEYLPYALGLPPQTEIDWWEDKMNNSIWWNAEIFFSTEGISYIRGLVERASCIITFRIHEDDLRTKDILRLSEDRQLYKTGDFYEGLIWVNTFTQKDWNVAFEVECENGVMMPTKMIINFMDKNILIL